MYPNEEGDSFRSNLRDDTERRWIDAISPLRFSSFTDSSHVSEFPMIRWEETWRLSEGRGISIGLLERHLDRQIPDLAQADIGRAAIHMPNAFRTSLIVELEGVPESPEIALSYCIRSPVGPGYVEIIVPSSIIVCLVRVQVDHG